MNTTTFATLKKELSEGKTSCQTIVHHYLQRIEELNPTLNVFLEVYAEEARQKAIEIDQKIATGTAGRLAGMVIGLKDVLAHKTTVYKLEAKF